MVIQLEAGVVMSAVNTEIHCSLRISIKSLLSAECWKLDVINCVAGCQNVSAVFSLRINSKIPPLYVRVTGVFEEE